MEFSFARQPLLLVFVVASLSPAAIEFHLVDETNLPSRPPATSFLRDWLVLGPFWSTQCSPEHLQSFIAPHAETIGKIGSLSEPVPFADAVIGMRARWEPLTVPADAPETPQLDLNAAVGKLECAVLYLGAYVFAQEPCSRKLLFGSDDGAAIWINGQQLIQLHEERPFQVDENAVEVPLNQGRNLLIVQVTQLKRSWEFGCRFEDAAGLAIGTSEDPAQAKTLAQPAHEAVIVAGPYVQNVSTDAATIFWQTDVPAVGRLTLFTPEGSTYVETQAPSVLNEVRVTGLAAGTTYPYQVAVWPAEAPLAASYPAGGQFRTFAPDQASIRCLIYGDSRSHPERHAMVASRMYTEPNVDFVIHSGDLVADGRVLEQWVPQHFEPARALMAKYPLYVCLGNHENDSPYYFTYFDLPGIERWYSFDVGPVHFIALDSNVDYTPGSEQFQWLVNDLQANRDKRWKVVVSHHPAWTSGPHGRLGEDGRPRETPTRTAQDIFPALAKEYGIDLFVAGHDHTYERSSYENVPYIVSGGGGAPPYEKVDNAQEQNPHSVVFYSKLNYCVLDADAERLLLVAKDELGRTLDRLELVKNK